MTKREAIKIAKEIAGDRATVTPHQGETRKDRGIRISGCDLADAGAVGREIAAALPGGAYRQSGNFACVWYD